MFTVIIFILTIVLYMRLISKDNLRTEISREGQNYYCRIVFGEILHSKVRWRTMGYVRPWPGAIMCNNYARSTLVGSITPSFSHTHFTLFFQTVLLRRAIIFKWQTYKATAKTNRKTVWVISIPVFFKQSNVLQFVALPFFFNVDLFYFSKWKCNSMNMHRRL